MDLNVPTVADRILNYLKRSEDRVCLDSFLVKDCGFLVAIDTFLENVEAFLQSGYESPRNFDMAAEYM